MPSQSFSSRPRSTQAQLGSRTLSTPHAREFARAISCLRGTFGELLTPDNIDVFYEMAFLKRRALWHPLFTELGLRAKAGFPEPFRLPANITDTTAHEMGLDQLITAVYPASQRPR